ncbi:hypothetical protein K435DRAFT_867095 [Dendrothele bispora CBS 962.96]|uniref:Uncharacterized protein n=1 Tax=Dendrothele bispora (strain CBS 962.96) TaxID=1314807 RepID=A0A4S8LFC3_DENBC|nr:hypothetical protein K435DRAFT_867095 [Dendrothele bispora CBS 962.96]
MTTRHRTGKSKAPRLTAADYRPTVIENQAKQGRNAPRALVHLSGSRYLMQDSRLPRLQGQVGFNSDHPAKIDDEDPIMAAPATQHTDAGLDITPLETYNEDATASPSKTQH